MVKTIISCYVQADVASAARASGKNISAVVESLLRQYFSISEAEAKEANMDALKAELAAVQAQIKDAEAAKAKAESEWTTLGEAKW